jgi:putative transposase
VANRTLPLDDDGMYHVYNRAVGSELLFHCSKDYVRFLENIDRYLLPEIMLWSYALLPNHFHLLFSINDKSSGKSISKAISDCCNSYTKWLNTISGRRGNLFMRPFKRTQIENDNHLAWTIWYIHRNPVHHHCVLSVANWQYSSYTALAGDSETRVARREVLSFFGGKEKFIRFHIEQQQGYYDTLEIE